jgi:hypothetical protein
MAFGESEAVAWESSNFTRTLRDTSFARSAARSMCNGASGALDAFGSATRATGR